VKARDVSLLGLQRAEDSNVLLNLLPARVLDWIAVAEHMCWCVCR
jgi:hypothetical protein